MLVIFYDIILFRWFLIIRVLARLLPRHLFIFILLFFILMLFILLRLFIVFSLLLDIILLILIFEFEGSTVFFSSFLVRRIILIHRDFILLQFFIDRDVNLSFLGLISLTIVRSWMCTVVALISIFTTLNWCVFNPRIWIATNPFDWNFSRNVVDFFL